MSKRLGRPPKKEPRDEEIKIRVTEREKELVKKRAGQSSVTDYVRKMLGI